MTVQEMLTWAAQNPVVMTAAVVYVVVNVAPRPRPSDTQSRFERFFWTVLDRISVLTAESVPGRLKWLFASSPPPRREDDPELSPVVTTVAKEPDGRPPEKGSL
jgi:hypothetical protein